MTGFQSKIGSKIQLTGYQSIIGSKIHNPTEYQFLDALVSLAFKLSASQ